MNTLMLFLAVIGVLLLMTGCTGGGLWFLVPGIACVVAAVYLEVKRNPKS